MNTIRCPKCRKMIKEQDGKCIYCGFDGISSYVSSLKTKNKKQEKSINNNSDSAIGFLVLSFIVFVCVLIVAAKWNSKDKKCKVCNGTGYYQKKTCVFCDGTGEYNPDKDPYKFYKELYGD